MKNTDDKLNILRSLNKNPNIAQRKLAKNLGFSLGKLNYCLNALKAKGLIKLKNFRNNKNKIGYSYLLTPKGFSEKTRLTVSYMKTKMREYDELKYELQLRDRKKKNVDSSKD